MFKKGVNSLKNGENDYMDIIKLSYDSTKGVFVQNRIIDRNYVVKATSHPQYELVYIAHGKVGLTVNGEYSECIGGEIIMLKDKIYHSQRMFEGIETELYVVEFKREQLPPCVVLDFFGEGKDNPLWGHRIPADVVRAGNLSRYFRRITDLAKKKALPYKDALVVAELIKLICAINVEMDKVSKTGLKTDAEAKRTKDLVEKCIRYIDANLTRQISLDDIATAVHFSKSYLQHIFKQKMGMSISAYINAQKMSYARSMLVAGENPSVVAQKLGYEYYTTFSVKFKNYFGIPPKDIHVIPYQKNRDMEKS